MSSSIDCNEYNVEELLALTRLAEAADRFPDMCKFMNVFVKRKYKDGKNLNVDERNLLSVAYKNLVGSKRQSWRTLSNKESPNVELDAEVQKAYQALVENELKTVCRECLALLDDVYKQVERDLIKETSSEDSKDKLTPEDGVFYLKMCGDYYRYLAEIDYGQDGVKAEQYYQQAMTLAKDKLPETHPTRLGLALNFSVCYYEILRQKDKACKLAKEAFDAAIEKLDTLNDSSYKDSTLIMQLLRDNLTLWTQEKQDDKDDNAEQA